MAVNLRSFVLISAIAVQAYAQSPSVVLEDQEFTVSPWVSKILPASVGNGTVTATTESTGGNPGSYRHVVYNATGTPFMVSHLRTGDALLSYSPADQGALHFLTYSFDVKVIHGAAGAIYQLALFQNGATYAAQYTHPTDGLTAWTKMSGASSLAAGGFTKIDGSGPASPDFSATGAPIYFGYITSNPASQTCDMYYGCYSSSTPSTTVSPDTGIDNLTVNIFGEGAPAGVTCAMTPVNRYIPFHIPALHISKPDQYPNHKLEVLVTLNGQPVRDVIVTLSAGGQTALATGVKAPPTMPVASATTAHDGNALFFHNTPTSGPYSRTDFKATGTFEGHDFSCQSAVITGVGAGTEAIMGFYRSPGAQQPAVLALRAVLVKDRSLTDALEQNPRFQPLLRKILAMQASQWSAHEARVVKQMLAEIERNTRGDSRELAARVKQDFQEALTGRHPGSRNRSGELAIHPGPIDTARIREDFGRLPLGFERNQGQFQRDIRYLARASGFQLALTDEGAVLINGTSSGPRRASAVRMQFPGARPPQRIVALDEQTGVTNYLIGNDPSKWRSGVSRFGQVKYESIYPGVDLVFHGNGRNVEFDFVVAPGAHPGKIRVGFRGEARLQAETGGLVLHDAAGSLRLAQPLVYQEDRGARKLVAGQFVVGNSNEVSFQVGPYDVTKPLVIDPVLSYSSLLGGSDFEIGGAIAVDAQGNVYVTGITCSVDFPTLHALHGTLSGGEGPTDTADLFVTKLDPTGTHLIYSTYIGGSGTIDAGLAIAVDTLGSAYVAGSTNSVDFPLAHPIQSIFGGGPAPSDAFALKLDSTGSTLIFSTYLGGSGDDHARAIAVDTSGNAYVAGQTSSPNFPLKNALQTKLGGEADAFVAKLNSTGTDFIYSTFLGGRLSDIAMALAIDPSGSTYVTGITSSADFPTVNPFQAKKRGGTDGFVSKIAPGGTTLSYSTYLGGTSDDMAMGIAIDPAGSAYITGISGSPDFPLSNPLQTAFGSSDGFGLDAFVTKLDATGSNLAYSTLLGGKGIDMGLAIAVGADGSAFVAGETESTDFPTVGAVQSFSGPTEAFVAKLNPAGSHLTYSTPVGGSASDSLAGIAMDSTGNLYLVGTTGSTDFPATFGAYQTAQHGGTDVLVVKIIEGASTPKFNSVSAATFQAGPVAPESIVAGFGDVLATTTASASSLPLPQELANTSVHVKDSSGNDRLAHLFFVSSKQVNYLIPAGTATGLAEVTVVSAGKTVAAQTLSIAAISPALFTANGDGHGVAAGSFVQTPDSGPLFQCGSSAGSCTAVPVDLGDGSKPVFLTIFGTGIRGRSDLSAVSAKLADVSVPVAYAGAAGAGEGLDQINVGPLPLSLKGRGQVQLQLSVDGKVANTVSVSIK